MRFIYFLLLICFFSSLCVAQTPSLSWAKSIGGTASDYAYAVDVDQYGNVYTSGFFSGTVDFDPGVGIFNLSASQDIFISKLDVNGNFIWAKKIGGSLDDYAYTIKVDDIGNVYTSGYFRGTVDFDPNVGTNNLSSSGSSRDVFILKLSSGGNFIWARQFSGGLNEEGLSLAIDAQNNVYSSGYFQHTVDFDPGPTIFNLSSASLTVDDIFISKLDSMGQFVWAKRIGGTLNDHGRSLSTDPSGNIYITGDFSGTADFDPGTGVSNLSSAGGYDIFILKLNAAGNFTWAKRIGVSIDEVSYSIALDASNHVICTGTFNSTTDFDPGNGVFNLVSAGSGDVFILKLDSSGQFDWAKSVGGNSTDKALAIATDAFSNIYTMGYFFGTADLEPGPGVLNISSQGGYDCWISRLDSNGQTNWIRSFGGSGNDIGYGLKLDAFNNIHAVGNYYASVDFDLDTNAVFNLNATSTSTDLFIFKTKQGNCIGPSIPLIIANKDTICEGQQLLLSIDTGSLNAASAWKWYTNSCGGTFLDSGASITVTPSMNTIYYARGEGACFGPGWCGSKSVVVLPLPAVTVSNVTGCAGNGIQLIGTPLGGVFSKPNPYLGPSTKYTYSFTDQNGCTSIADSAHIMVDTCLLTLNLKVFLEGYYQGSSTMRPVLLNQGVITSNNIVDNLIIELHSMQTPFTTIASATSFLMTNGMLSCQFQIPMGQYYISVIHRNSIKTWSGFPILFNQLITNYDFTDAASKAFGDNMKELDPGIWGLFAGDLNLDENTDLQDIPLLENDINQFSFGYASSDINGDGTVDLQDVPFLEFNMKNFIFSSHP